MSKSQRTKGAVFEREIAREFTDALALPGVEFKRNIGQARDGGNDLDVGPLVVECKRRASLKTIEGWREQARRAAFVRQQNAALRGDPSEPCDHIPCVVFRADLGQSLIILDLRDFLTLAGPELRRRISGGAR